MIPTIPSEGPGTILVGTSEHKQAETRRAVSPNNQTRADRWEWNSSGKVKYKRLSILGEKEETKFLNDDREIDNLLNKKDDQRWTFTQVYIQRVKIAIEEM